jgi:hypothetical protein
VAAKRVQGVNGTIKDLLAVEEAFTIAEANEIMDTAKLVAAALRASVPNPPLSNMEPGPVRAHIKRGNLGRYYGVKDSHRLGSIHLTGPLFAVISDMAMNDLSGAQTMSQNLINKYGRASRFVWPTAERFLSAFRADIVQANGKATVAINSRLRKVHP